MIGNHDWTRPIRTNDLDATLVTLEDGERAVRLTGLVHQADLEAVGEIGGMSFSSFEPTGRADGPNRDAPALKLSADAGWFDDETIGEALSVSDVDQFKLSGYGFPSSRKSGWPAKGRASARRMGQVFDVLCDALFVERGTPLALYQVLERVSPGPVVHSGRSVIDACLAKAAKAAKAATCPPAIP